MSEHLALEALELVTHVMHGIAEAEERREVQHWQRDVQFSIDQLVQKSDDLLAELRSLGISLKDEVYGLFQTEYLNRLHGELLNLSILVSSTTLRDDIPLEKSHRLLAAVERVRTIAFSAMTYGNAAVPLALIAMATVLFVMNVLNVAEAETSATRSHFRRHVVSRLLDSESAESLVSAERKLAKTIEFNEGWYMTTYRVGVSIYERDGEWIPSIRKVFGDEFFEKHAGDEIVAYLRNSVLPDLRAKYVDPIEMQRAKVVELIRLANLCA